jgi:hypothetical protein
MITSIGSLIYLGYLTDPATVYCPDQMRGKPNFTFLNMDKYPDRFRDIADGDDTIAIAPGTMNSGNWHSIGYTTYLFKGEKIKKKNLDPWTEALPWFAMEPRNMTLRTLEARYNRAGWSPMMYSCVQDQPNIYYRSHVDARGYGAGVNGAMVDGSVRWVSHTEVERLAEEAGKFTWVAQPDKLLGNGGWANNGADDNGKHNRLQWLAHQNLTLTGG